MSSDEESVISPKGIRQFVMKEVEDWDDEEKGKARFKAFSGQRPDWDPLYSFWRDLIIKVAAHLRTILIRPSQVKNVWFRREGLTPLCLDRVLLEMYNAGDLLRKVDLVDPTSGHLKQMFRKIVSIVQSNRPSISEDLSEEFYIISTLLKDKALEVIEVLSQNHWTSSCVVTMSKFIKICGGSNEASAILSYLSECGKAKYLLIKRKDIIEGVKISLLPGQVSNTTSLDYDILHLICTVDKLEQQLDVIDQRCKKSRKSALAALRSGNKKIGLKHAREIKRASQSREQCVTLLNRVEDVLRVIADAESSRKQISEAIYIGAQAIKQNRISFEEVELYLLELDESIYSQNQVDRLLGSSPAYIETQDEDIECEFKTLELEIGNEPAQVPQVSSEVDNFVGKVKSRNSADKLDVDMVKLKLTDGAESRSVSEALPEDANIEAA